MKRFGILAGEVLRLQINQKYVAVSAARDDAQPALGQRLGHHGGVLDDLLLVGLALVQVIHDFHLLQLVERARHQAGEDRHLLRDQERREGETEDPGMSEENASFAVLGADAEAIGLAVAVPAVLGYNFLVRRNKAVMEQVNAFGSDLHAVLLGSAKK